MKQFLSAVFFLFTIIIFSQEKEDDTSIEGQFDKIYRTSTSYNPKDTQKRYKVINITSYNKLKVNVLDSLNSSKKNILEKEALLKTERAKTNKINQVLNKTKSELDIALTKENSISLLGIQSSKSLYNLILWSIIILLSLGLAYFVFKFFRSNILTKEAKDNLYDVEQEFEQHRKKSLLREQKLRRQLQDEINKQRNV